FAPLIETRLDGTPWAPNGRGNFVGGQWLYGTQYKDQAGGRWQFEETGLAEGLHLLSLGGSARTATCGQGGLGAGGVRRFQGLEGRALVSAFAPFIAQAIAGNVAHDAVEPGVDARRAAKGVDALKGPHECFLGRVLRVFVISEEPIRHVV